MKCRSLVLGILFPAALVLSACGGGGGGSNPPSSSSVPSSSASSVSSSFSSGAANSQLTIQGKAVASALAGGEVVFTIGQKTFKANIDDTLKYSVLLDVPTEDLNVPFSAIATGSGVDSWVQLAASFPSVSALIAKAGSDTILNAEEFFGVNISVLTTAQYAEITARHSAIATDDDRKSALLESHSIRSLEKAALLSRVLTDIDVDLPKPAVTTLGFLLDLNLSDTYNEILRNTNNSELSEHIKALGENASVSYVSAAKLSGRYFLEALNLQYELTFNDDGTGRLNASTIDGKYYAGSSNDIANVDFSWIRKSNQIKIQFAHPVTYSNYDYRLEDGTVYNCDNFSTGEVEYCDIAFNSIQLNIVSDTEFSIFTQLEINAEISGEYNSFYNGVVSSAFARLISAENAVAITNSDLVGGEWIADHYSYVFNTDGTGKQINLLNKTESVVTWSINNKVINVGDVILLPISKSAVGYTMFLVDGRKVMRTLMIKRTPVVMTEADWVGRWTGSQMNEFANAYDVNANKTWADGFEAEVVGSWSVVDGHRQKAISNAAWRMDRDVLAIHGGKYYMSQCHGVLIDEENYNVANCFIAVVTRAENFDTNVFWGNWSYPAFNEKSNGDAWIPVGGYVFTSDGSSQMMYKFYSRVSATKLFSMDDHSILEMTSATKHEIELCEYQVYEQCEEQNKRRYERGVQIKISRNSDGGSLYMDYEGQSYLGYFVTTGRHIDKAIMLPKNRAQVIRLAPNSGYTIESDGISGCGGVLIGLSYEIPALQADCELTVNFTPLPL